MKVSDSFKWSKRRRGIKLALCGALTLSALQASVSAAADSALDSLQVHGFLSQALVITDDNNVFGPSSEGAGSLEYTELGVNVSLRPQPNLLLAAQFISRRAGGELSDAEPALDYGVIDYQLVANRARTTGVKLGRFKNPFGLYNETRDVAFTRPSILLPQSIYFDRTRSLALSGDGIGFYHEERLPSGFLRFQAGLGEVRLKNDAETSIGLAALPGSLEPGTSAIGQLRYEDSTGRFLVALSTARATADYANARPPLADGTLTFQPWLLSLQYNRERWSLTSEYAIRKLALSGFNPALDQSRTGESWYLQYARRVNRNWQWLVRFDRLIANRHDRSGETFEASGAGPAHSQFADDITLGVQWTPHSNVMLAGEYHHVDGTGWLPTGDNADSDEMSRYWNMLLLQLSLRF